jgi:excisionase family DNA binding protein
MPVYGCIMPMEAIVMARILTVEQAAEKLQLTPKTTRKLLKEGKMPGRKVGRAWRVLETDLEWWIGGKYQQPIPVSERKSILGLYKDMPGLSSEKFMAEKHAENEEQERKYDERQRARIARKGKAA